MAWKEAYGTFNLAFSGDIKMDTASILKSIFDSNPYKSFLEDLSPMALKGIGIVNATGRVLGVTSTATRLYNLGADIMDGDGRVEMKNVADAGISVGSLFIKSNAIGFTVSAGWLLIKGEFYE